MKKLIPILLLTLISPMYAKMYTSLLIRDDVQIGSLIIESPGELNFLYVIGNAHIGGSLNVQGSLTVNGVPISGSSGGSGGGGSGNVVGPSSPTTAGAVALFTDTTGKAIEQSAAPVTVNPSTNDMANVNNLTVTANINLPATATNYSQGVITLNGANFIHSAGGSNTALGQNALNAVGSGGGNFNVAIGSNALKATTGNSNVAVGFNALSTNVSGTDNIAIGEAALSASTNDSNIGIGSSALQNTTGSQNVAIGFAALSSLGNNTSITNNIALGYNAGSNLDNTGTNVNNIYIGSVGPASSGAENNTTRIGSQAVNSGFCYIGGIAGVTTTVVDAVPVLISASTAQLGTLSSSFRYKKNITSMESVIAALMKLRPVQFRYKIHDETVPLEYGLIAEEVAQVMPDMVIYKDGQPETVKYHLFSAILIKAIQELTLQNHAQQQVNEQLMQRIAALENTKQAM